MAETVTDTRLWEIIVTLVLVFHGGATQEDRESLYWDTNGQPIVHTFKGALKGLKEESISGRPFLSFYAIPYAKPPLGELRFQVYI